MSRTLSALAAAALLLLPLAASAHAHQTFRIGDKTYSFVMGSLAEPVVVDDKTGVDVAVTEHIKGKEDGTPVLGLEQTLRVEISAGNATKTLPLTAQYGKDGSYKAVFIPTIETTYTYRLTGTINGVQVDLPFTCNPAGHPRTEDDTTETPVSEGVTRISMGGAFGCPLGKADLGFPEPSTTSYDLQEAANAGSMAGIAGLVLGMLGLVAGVASWVKASRR